MKKLILTIALTALLLIVGQAAQAEPYQLPVRVHTLVACNQGALALTYTGEVFYIVGDNAAVVQITPRFFEGEMVYLEGICSGANDMFYAIAYGDDEPIICQATLEEEALVLSPLGKVAMGDGNFRLYDLMTDQSGVLIRDINETNYWNIATSKMEQLIGMDYRLMASGGGIIVALHSNNGNEELVRVDVAAQSSSAIRVLSQMPGQLAVSPDGQVVAWCVDSLVTAGRENTEQLLQGYMAGMDTRKDFPCCVTNDGRFYYANANAVSCVQLVEDYTIDMDSLVIGQSGMEEAITVNYRLTHPEASVVTRRLESDDPADIAQSIRMLDSSVDIYFTRTNFTGYQAMLEKGFCADLSGEAELSRQVNDMADCIRDAVTVDGKICAVPYGVIFGSFSTLGCSQAAFDTLGISISELPSSTDELLDCILSWIEAGMLDDLWLHDLHQDSSILYGLTLNNYISHARQDDGMVDLTASDFTALMMKLDRIIQWINTRDQPDDDAPALFSQKSLGYFLTSPEDDDWKMLRLTPYPMMTPSFDVCLNVAVVNPLSRHYEEAVSFLECVLQDMEPEAVMLLWPSRAQPVENPDYAQEWEYCHQEVLRLQAALETGEGSPQQKQALMDALEDAQAAMNLVEASRWRISERTVSSYLAAVPSLDVQKDSILDLVYDAGGLAIEQRYGAQQATMEELLLAFAHLSESIAKEE